jgi:hypothetical protein
MLILYKKKKKDNIIFTNSIMTKKNMNKKCSGTIYIISGKKWCVGEKKSKKFNKSKKSKKSKKI